MHGTPFPKITVLFVICLLLFCSKVFGQKKVDDGDVDITKCWSYPLGDAAGEQILTVGNRVFLGLPGAKIESLARDGKKIWSAEFGGEISSNIIAVDSGLFFTTSAVSNDSAKLSGGKLRWISKETGVTNWTVALPDGERYYLKIFNETVIVVSQNGTVESVDAKIGNIKWRRQIAEGFVANPSFTATSLTVATTGKQLFTISLSSGEIELMRKVAFNVTALSTTENGKLIVGDERGNVFTMNGDDRPIWNFKTGGAISNILSISDNILVASHDNFVYFLVARNGGRIWKKRFAGRVAQLMNVSDRLAVVSSFEERGAVLTDLSNGRVAGQIIFEEDESLVAALTVSDGVVFIVTDKAAYAYGLNGCP